MLFLSPHKLSITEKHSFSLLGGSGTERLSSFVELHANTTLHRLRLEIVVIITASFEVPGKQVAIAASSWNNFRHSWPCSAHITWVCVTWGCHLTSLDLSLLICEGEGKDQTPPKVLLSIKIYDDQVKVPLKTIYKNVIYLKMD